jgi:BirA family transcriptional regulator, biotin operon repressor / biotin---[acetyl-CoA-carboxylase] ligase
MITAVEKTASAVVGRAGWRLQTHGSVASTNTLARGLPAWSAVTAVSQTGGRGRFGRSFCCSPGGLWLSAVVPSPGGAGRWAGFSLGVGLHVLRAAVAAGVATARLRWPNDLMAGNLKLGGLLVEEGSRETLVVGLGINVFNRPWEDDASLEGVATRMADVTERPPEPGAWAVSLLDAIADAHASHASRGLAPSIGDLNRLWTRTPVLLLLHGEPPVRGEFLGLDTSGNLLVGQPDGTRRTIPHHHVQKLTET